MYEFNNNCTVISSLNIFYLVDNLVISATDLMGNDGYSFAKYLQLYFMSTWFSQAIPWGYFYFQDMFWRISLIGGSVMPFLRASGPHRPISCPYVRHVVVSLSLDPKLDWRLDTLEIEQSILGPAQWWNVFKSNYGFNVITSGTHYYIFNWSVGKVGIWLVFSFLGNLQTLLSENCSLSQFKGTRSW